MRRVVVTGIGVVSPLGVGVEGAWDALLNGCSGVHVAAWGEGLPSQVAATVPAIDEEVLRDCGASSTNLARFTKLGLVAATEALRGAGWDRDRESPRRALPGPGTVRWMKFLTRKTLSTAGGVCANTPRTRSISVSHRDTTWWGRGMNRLSPHRPKVSRSPQLCVSLRARDALRVLRFSSTWQLVRLRSSHGRARRQQLAAAGACVSKSLWTARLTHTCRG